ncbi:MAG: LamG domain-containing protein, partial [Deltaproteobacteria bacterium]|nr:LamG domain-containing protein [Deltaproteobacteria bacterium]
WIEPFPIDGQKVPTILSLHINGNNQLRIALNSSYILSVSVLKADTEIGRVSEPVITAGSWHHIAVVCKDPLKIYINGVDKTTTQASRIVRAVASCLNIGRLKPGTAHFEGKIDEVRIWGRERTREDIQEDMNRRLKGDEEGLMGYWRFDKGSGTVARDVTGKGNDGTLKGNAQWST